MKSVNWELMHTYTEKALKKTWALLENNISLSAEDLLKLSEIKREYEESVAKETKGKFRMKLVDIDDSKESKE